RPRGPGECRSTSSGRRGPVGSDRLFGSVPTRWRAGFGRKVKASKPTVLRRGPGRPSRGRPPPRHHPALRSDRECGSGPPARGPPAGRGRRPGTAPLSDSVEGGRRRDKTVDAGPPPGTTSNAAPASAVRACARRVAAPTGDAGVRSGRRRPVAAGRSGLAAGRDRPPTGGTGRGAGGDRRASRLWSAHSTATLVPREVGPVRFD